MRDRWSKEPGSPRHQRMGSMGSVAPSSSMPPIRKGQLVWNSEKGFVRESELRAGTFYILISASVTTLMSIS